ncbi:MAG: PRC-barrel domain-containing protein [Solirubrobacteraceae bacterium]
MNTPAQFTIGSKVVCSDGACGELTRVVVDPVARVLTHLVVDPRHRRGTGRLVPVELVESAAGEIALACTLAEFKALEVAEETQFLPGATGEWSYGQGEMFSSPYFGLGRGIRVASTYDRVPVGEVEVRRGEQVHATDGEIGHVRGLVIDASDNHVTHVLLDEGHLWGQKRVAIPIGAVREVADDGVWMTLTKDQIRDLPPVDVDGL